MQGLPSVLKAPFSLWRPHTMSWEEDNLLGRTGRVAANVPGTLQHRAALLRAQKNRCREASLRRTSELRSRFEALGTAWRRGDCSLRSVLVMPPAPSQRAWKASKASITQMQWHCDCCLESLSRVSELAIFRSSDVISRHRVRKAIGCCLKALLEVVNRRDLWRGTASSAFGRGPGVTSPASSVSTPSAAAPS